ncbi:hypothetical protein [Streptomyces sp. NPDC048641]|uniref:hypothetical protein n=1 Tax=Streptomyces sp. NPDC048641 TaxID=3154825 RepID=UPI003447EF66
MACSIIANTYIRVPDNVTVSKKSQASSASAWERSPVARSEPRSVVAELTFQHSDLMAHGEDLRVFVPIAHRQQAQYRERVRHTQVSQSKQHG